MLLKLESTDKSMEFGDVIILKAMKTQIADIFVTKWNMKLKFAIKR